MPSPTDYNLSPSDAAKILKVHQETVKRWVRKGLLRSFRTPGGWHRFSQADLDAFIARGVGTGDRGAA